MKKSRSAARPAQRPAVSRANRSADRTLTALVCVALIVLVWATFGRAAGFGFLNYDDNVYVYANPQITDGLSVSGVLWALTHVHADNWHPLTTITHMLDCQLFGVAPAGHHLVNVLLHSIAAVLLFLALRRLLGAADIRHTWMAAFVAALFAIHPLRVESVAWVSELKDVLSGIFFMLTLIAYSRYVRARTRSAASYAWALGFYAAGLMSKPTLVTLPFLLLLLDYWPLRRLPSGQAQNGLGEPEGFRLIEDEPAPAARRVWLVLLAEKAPFLFLSALSCVATLIAQTRGIAALHKITPAARVANALISYCQYIAQSFWPANLSVWYPYPRELHLGTAAAALLLLGGITVAAVYWRRTYPFLLVGWLWFLGVLVPMIGLVQVGKQARADRYTYLSTIGLYLIVAWGVASLAARWRLNGKLLIIAASLITLALAVRSYRQSAYWENSYTLWQHAIDATSNSYIAHYNLGNAFAEGGRSGEAISEYRSALAIEPNDPEIQNNLCNALSFAQRFDEAIVACNDALRLNPEAYESFTNLGSVLAMNGKTEEAVARFRDAIRIKPDYAVAHLNLARALRTLGRSGEAAAELAEGERLQQEQKATGQTDVSASSH